MIFLAQLRESGTGMERFAVTIRDLSVYGFRFETSFTLWSDSNIWLTIPGLEVLHARVIWSEDARYGAKFDQPLHPAVLDHIMKQNRRS
jgi:PilZ domain